MNRILHGLGFRPGERFRVGAAGRAQILDGRRQALDLARRAGAGAGRGCGHKAVVHRRFEVREGLPLPRRLGRGLESVGLGRALEARDVRAQARRGFAAARRRRRVAEGRASSLGRLGLGRKAGDFFSPFGGAPLSVSFRSFRLILGRASISHHVLQVRMLSSKRTAAKRSSVRSI